MDTTTIVNFGQEKFEITWLPDSFNMNYSPITQVYGIIFSENVSEILVCKLEDSLEWVLAGGTVEEEEDLETTLKREIREELNITLKNIHPLGVQRVLPLQDMAETNRIKNGPSYQARFIAQIDESLPRRPDPANGKMWEYKFVPADEIDTYIDWGNSGRAMFRDAIKLAIKVIKHE